MTPDDPRHGSNAGAMQHWRDNEPVCGHCQDGARRLNKAAQLDRLRGTPRMTTLGHRAIQVINDTPLKQLSTATGIRVDKLIRYRHAGPEGRVHRTTRNRILAAGTRQFWTPVGIQRRLRALSAMGWSMLEVANRTGAHVDGLKRLRRRESPVFVREVVALAVLDVYEQLQMDVPPRADRSARRTRAHARAEKWVPPFAWDNIDDENEQPTGVRDPNRTLDRTTERADIIREINDRGGNHYEAARTIGIRQDALEKWCDRHDMRAVYNQLRERAHLEDKFRNTGKDAA